MKRIPELDGLRGIAASGIVFFHIDPTYIFWMWTFVDLFFVLSGFLITRILLQSMARQRLSLRDFWMRRILRIWPVYYVSLLGVILLLLLQRGPDYLLGPRSADVSLSFVFLQYTPLYWLHIGDHEAMFNFLPGFVHSWSLAVEEQFYLLWPPLLILLVRRWGLRGAGWACLGIAMAGPLSRALFEWPAVLLFTRIEGLALGALMAIMVTAELNATGAVRPRRWQWPYVGAVVLGLLGVMPHLLQGYRYGVGPSDVFYDPLLVTSFVFIYFGVVGFAVTQQGSRWLWLFRMPLLTYLGGISYALYMYHYPVLVFIEPQIAEFFAPGLEWLSAVLAVLLIVGLAHASGVILERPFLLLKRRFSRGGAGAAATFYPREYRVAKSAEPDSAAA